MAITISADVQLGIVLKEVVADGVRTGMLPSSISENLNLLNGTADGQINAGYYKRETGKAASSTTRYDLKDGTLLDSSGAAVTFAEVVLIAVRNLRTTTGAYIDVGPSGTHPLASAAGSLWGTTTSLSRANAGSGWLVVYSPVGQAVASGSADAIDVVASAVAGDTNTWDILILGRAS